MITEFCSFEAFGYCIFMPDFDPIPSPEEATYPTPDAAIDALFQHGRQNGYCVKLKRTKPDGTPHKTKYFYICDRGRYVEIRYF